MKSKKIISGLLIVLVLLGVFTGISAFLKHTGCPATSYTPTLKFNISWDTQTEGLIVRHAGGDKLSPNDDEGTIGLYITILDNELGEKERITWFNSEGYVHKKGGSLPISEGDELVLYQSDLTSDLSSGDVVKVWWRGNIGYPQPFWCFNQGAGNHLLSEEIL